MPRKHIFSYYDLQKNSIVPGALTKSVTDGPLMTRGELAGETGPLEAGFMGGGVAGGVLSFGAVMKFCVLAEGSSSCVQCCGIFIAAAAGGAGAGAGAVAGCVVCGAGVCACEAVGCPLTSLYELACIPFNVSTRTQPLLKHTKNEIGFELPNMK
ncbi:MAG TPA: hypothetical protein VI522_00935 [Gammaproteobacteria bacterium]|nr:hypothetical protein [Gammaproteobacteria bacterium]